jgi:hypothetical protein
VISGALVARASASAIASLCPIRLAEANERREQGFPAYGAARRNHV